MKPILIKPKIFQDDRGYFFEKYKQSSYAELGIKLPFVQVNESRSEKNTLRGLHLQLPPHEQGKLVSVVEGEIFDVAIDINPSSETYKHVDSAVLSSQNKHAFYVPPGYAHGFYVLSDVAVVQYMCTAEYNHPSELGIRWDDPELAIEWPSTINSKTLSLSEKDAKASRLKDVESILKSAYSS